MGTDFICLQDEGVGKIYFLLFKWSVLFRVMQFKLSVIVGVKGNALVSQVVSDERMLSTVEYMVSQSQ